MSKRSQVISSKFNANVSFRVVAIGIVSLSLAFVASLLALQPGADTSGVGPSAAAGPSGAGAQADSGGRCAQDPYQEGWPKGSWMNTCYSCKTIAGGKKLQAYCGDGGNSRKRVELCISYINDRGKLKEDC